MHPRLPVSGTRVRHSWGIGICMDSLAYKNMYRSKIILEQNNTYRLPVQPHLVVLQGMDVAER
jgi:hypothetical protein